jgi:hypothetical protein
MYAMLLHDRPENKGIREKSNENIKFPCKN